MKFMYQKFVIHFDNDENLFMIACKDRGCTIEDRFVICTLSKDEAKQLHDYISKFLKEES